MKDKIFKALKQAYSALGLGDEILQAQAENLAGLGLVTDDNIQTVVEAQKSYLESLQRLNDKRVTDARKKLLEEQAKAEAERKAKEDAEAVAKKAEADRIAKEEAERKRIEELKKQNEIPDALKKFIEEQAEKNRIAEENANKERSEFKQILESLKASTDKKQEEYLKQIETMSNSSKEQGELIKSLQDTIKKQQEEAKAKEEAQAKEKAVAEHKAKILSKAKELGIPQSRIDEGFVIADDADDETIGNVLTKVANNCKTLQQPVYQGYSMVSGEPTKEQVDDVASKMVNNL